MESMRTRFSENLGWSETFETDPEKTVKWYLEDRAWWQAIIERGY